MNNFSVDEQYILGLLEQAKNVSAANIDVILSKAESMHGLHHYEIAALLMCNSNEIWELIFRIAGQIKKNIYGDRVVMFAPLYVSDYCVNNCTYCGFRHNSNHVRRRLSQEEVRKEVEILAQMGHKRLALEAGEDGANCPIDYMLECIKTIYDTKIESGNIRRVNVNIAATTVENYKKLKDSNIGTYILFQETYHRQAYEKYHLGGPKADFTNHLTAFDRAMQAGIDDVGAGVLFGLHDYKFEIMALMLHNEHLEKNYGTGFHTISTPRVRCGGEEGLLFTNEVNDNELKKIVAILRIAVPFTGMIISTRETAEMRKQLINLGVSQLSGGSSVEVGGYSKHSESKTQFEVADNRNASEIIYWLMEEGLIPSFCTACYRKQRTGDRFMQLAKTGAIKDVCLPNALLTLAEYAADYGDNNFKRLAKKTIEKHIDNITTTAVKNAVKQSLTEIALGNRDLFL